MPRTITAAKRSVSNGKRFSSIRFWGANSRLAVALWFGTPLGLPRAKRFPMRRTARAGPLEYGGRLACLDI